MINPELKEGDRVVCLQMEDEFSSVPPGTAGTVERVSEIFGITQYNVTWDNGSTLALLSDVDAWDFEENMKKRRRKINEDIEGINDTFMKNIDVFKNFKMKFLKDYLVKLRDCGVTNMLGAAPYLYMGRDRMEIDFKYHNADDEICDEVLEMANLAQAEMIAGVIKVLESKNKEVSLDNINSYLRRYSSKILENYIALLSL